MTSIKIKFTRQLLVWTSDTKFLKTWVNSFRHNLHNMHSVMYFMQRIHKNAELWYSPKPKLMATGDRSTGPNCFGSPASTNCPSNLPFSFSLENRPAIGISASGSTAWPLSSINKCEKWPGGIHALTSLMRKRKQWGEFVMYNDLKDY